MRSLVAVALKLWTKCPASDLPRKASVSPPPGYGLEVVDVTDRSRRVCVGLGPDFGECRRTRIDKLRRNPISRVRVVGIGRGVRNAGAIGKICAGKIVAPSALRIGT